MMGIISAITGWLTKQLGLTTDAASSAGSLHAKVKDIADNKIGDSADARADNTVMGWLNTQVKSWQHITTGVTGSTVAITAVTASKCIVLVTGGSRHSEATDKRDVYVPHYVSAFTNTTITLSWSFAAPSGYTTTGGTVSVIIIELY